MCVCQTAKYVRESYDTLVDIFECIENFTNRLKIYTEIQPTPIMIETMVKIMVELLGVLSLATKQINQGRLSTSCSTFSSLLDGLTPHREIRKKATGRDGYRIGSSTSRSTHSRRVEDDHCPDTQRSVWSGHQHGSRDGRCVHRLFVYCLCGTMRNRVDGKSSTDDIRETLGASS